MFAKTIVDSDAFLEMPMSARLLYYDLAMRADDDGFINAPKKIMKFIGATNDDMNILILRKFIIPFDNGVVVIKHWRIHNYIRKDTYNETSYKEEKSMLELDENKAYRLARGRAVDEPSTQVRLGKDSIDIYMSEKSDDCVEEKSKIEQLKHDFDIIYKSYPKKVGKTKGFEYYKAWVTKGREISGVRYHLTNKQIWAAIAKYKRQLEESGTDLQYCKNFDTFMCKAILDYVEEDG